MRLDVYLVAEGHYESRNRALEAIKRGLVSVDGKSAKASQKVLQGCNIDLIDEKFYVSRAAKKLEGFLQEYPVEIKDRIALDIGSSTGGFSQILLELGVGHLACVDVGKNQLHSLVRDNNRVSVYEETDIRGFDADSFGLIVCDISFISIMHIMDDIERLSSFPSDIIILYKPQFEVGRDTKRDSRGVVVSQDIIQEKMRIFEDKAIDIGWNLKQKVCSKLSGKEGNQEYVFHFTKNSK